MYVLLEGKCSLLVIINVKKIVDSWKWGREHAIAWKLAEDAKREKRNIEIFCAPGNAGTQTCLDIKGDNIDGLINYAYNNNVSKRCIGAYEVLTGKTSIDSLRLKTVDEVIQEINME